MAEHEVIDGAVVEAQEPQESEYTSVPQDTPEPSENMTDPDQPEVPRWAFGQKAVLTSEQEQQVVRNRIAAHEEAIANDELLLWEARLLGRDDTEIVKRINLTYALVQRYVDAFNESYGGNENG